MPAPDDGYDNAAIDAAIQRAASEANFADLLLADGQSVVVRSCRLARIG